MLKTLNQSWLKTEKSHPCDRPFRALLALSRVFYISMPASQHFTHINFSKNNDGSIGTFLAYENIKLQKTSRH